MIPLKDNFKQGQPLAGLSADWLNTVARLLNGARLDDVGAFLNQNGLTFYSSSTATGSDFAWNVTGEALEITVTPGDIELGPDTVIEWGDITGASETVTATTGDATLWIWVNVDVANETAEMFSGTSITALSSEEKKTIRQKRIAKVSFTADTVTAIARYQCGNIDIPRL